MSGKFKSISLAGRGLALAALAILLPTQSAQASSTANTPGTTTAAVVASITVIESAQLNFGSVAIGDGTRTVAATTAPTFANGARGAFAVGGAPALAYQVSAIPGYNLTSGANNMAIGSFTGSCNGGATSGVLSSTLTGCALTAGADTLYVGATITIGGAQASGTYTGNYTVTVTYQ